MSVFPAAATLMNPHVCFPMIDSTEKDMTAFLGVGQVVWTFGRSPCGVEAKDETRKSPVGGEGGDG